MNKIKDNFAKKILNNEWIYAIISNAVLAGILLAYSAPHYSTNDDLTLAWIAAGQYGDGNRAFLVFSNIIYGAILRCFYYVTEAINWYAVVPLMISFACFVVLTYLFQKITDRITGRVIAFIVFMLFGQYLFYDFHFTHNAGFCSAVGLFCICESMFFETENRNKKSPLWIFGIIVSVFGFWLRSLSFVSVAAIVACFLLIYVAKSGKNMWRDLLKKSIPFIILGVLVLASYGVNQYVYQTDDEWRYFIEYNNLRAELLDYPLPDYETYEDEYNAIGIDEIDMEMFKAWTFADTNKFSLETLKKMTELKKEVDSSISISELIRSSIQTLKVAIEESYLLLIILTLMLFYLCFGQKYKWMIILPFLCVIAEHLLLIMRGRAPFRAYFPVWLAYFLFLLYFTMKECSVIKMSKRVAVFVVSTTVVVSIPLMNQLFVTNEMPAIIDAQDSYTKWINYLAKDSETLYVYDVFEARTIQNGLILRKIDGQQRNIYELGGWTVPAPLTNDILKSHDIDGSVYEALLDPDKNVYYVASTPSNTVELHLKYLQKEYDKNAKYEIVDTNTDMNIYRFYIEEELDFTKAKEDEKMLFELNPVNEKVRYVKVSGSCRVPDTDAYKQQIWMKILNKETGEIKYELAKKERRKAVARKTGNRHDVATGFKYYFKYEDYEKSQYEIKFYVVNGNNIITNDLLSCEIELK